MEEQAKDIWKAPVEVEQERSRDEDFSEYLEDLFMWLCWRPNDRTEPNVVENQTGKGRLQVEDGCASIMVTKSWVQISISDSVLYLNKL